MKKFIALAALVLACNFAANAQLAIGIGYTDAKHQTTVTTTDPVIRHADDAFIEATYETTNNGLIHFFPGVKMTFNLDTNDKDVDKQNFSIEIPLMAKCNLAIGNNNELFVFAGPTAFYSPAINNSSESSYFSDGKSTFNVLLGGGIGFDLLNRFRLKAGVNYGLINEAKSDLINTHTTCIYGGIGFIL